jgi:hypothetical protein
MLPSLLTIRQRLLRPKIDDVPGMLASRIRESGLLTSVKPDARIAITAGSRGIADIPVVLRTIVTECRHAGAEPFLVPAMGSHGGGTAEGQRGVLASLGITEESIGVPIISSMETVRIGETPAGMPVYCDRAAFESDGIIVVNRVKVHTSFHGKVESGLCKMLTVGLGKVAGAEAAHDHGLAEATPSGARVVIGNAPVLMGVALLENAHEELMDIRVVPPDGFEAADCELLELNRKMLPHIPCPEFDILVVDEMGKDISGTGMDTNVIGFWRRYGGKKAPDYQILVALSLTPASNGNAMGVGMADFIPRSLADSIDRAATTRNALTSQPSLGELPAVLDSDRLCIETALARCTTASPRIVRIKNTRDLETLQVTENLAESLRDNPAIEVVSGPEPMAFDHTGALR